MPWYVDLRGLMRTIRLGFLALAGAVVAAALIWGITVVFSVLLATRDGRPLIGVGVTNSGQQAPSITVNVPTQPAPSVNVTANLAPTPQVCRKQVSELPLVDASKQALLMFSARQAPNDCYIVVEPGSLVFAENELRENDRPLDKAPDEVWLDKVDRGHVLSSMVGFVVIPPSSSLPSVDMICRGLNRSPDKCKRLP